MYSARSVPGFCATLSAPGMWLTANSAVGRASKTYALPASRIAISSAVETSGVGLFEVETTPFTASGGVWARAAVERAVRAPTERTTTWSLEWMVMFASFTGSSVPCDAGKLQAMDAGVQRERLRNFEEILSPGDSGTAQ